MGTTQSCCGGDQQNHDKPTIKDRNRHHSLKQNRSGSVPLILKEGTPAYESVVTPNIDRSNGCVTEKDLLEVLHKPLSVSSDPQNFHLVQEEKGNQPLLAKTFTTPNLDKDDALDAPQQIWEHTQSLNTIKLLASGKEKVSNDFIEVRVKHDDVRQEKGEAEIVYVHSYQEESSDDSSRKCSNIIIEEHSLSRIPNTNDFDCEQRAVVYHHDSEHKHTLQIPIEGTKSSSSSSAVHSQYHNIFDVEFRKHNESVARSRSNTYSSSYKEVRTTLTPSPKIKRHEARSQLSTTSQTTPNSQDIFEERKQVLHGPTKTQSCTSEEPTQNEPNKAEVREVFKQEKDATAVIDTTPSEGNTEDTQAEPEKSVTSETDISTGPYEENRIPSENHYPAGPKMLLEIETREENGQNDKVASKLENHSITETVEENGISDYEKTHSPPEIINQNCTERQTKLENQSAIEPDVIFASKEEACVSSYEIMSNTETQEPMDQNELKVTPSEFQLRNAIEAKDSAASKEEVYVSSDEQDLEDSIISTTESDQNELKLTPTATSSSEFQLRNLVETKDREASKEEADVSSDEQDHEESIISTTQVRGPIDHNELKVTPTATSFSKEEADVSFYEHEAQAPIEQTEPITTQTVTTMNELVHQSAASKEECDVSSDEYKPETEAKESIKQNELILAPKITTPIFELEDQVRIEGNNGVSSERNEPTGTIQPPQIEEEEFTLHNANDSPENVVASKQRRRFKVEAEINLAAYDCPSVTHGAEQPSSPSLSNDGKLYSSVVKEGTLPRRHS